MDTLNRLFALGYILIAVFFGPQSWVYGQTQQTTGSKKVLWQGVIAINTTSGLPKQVLTCADASHFAADKHLPSLRFFFDNKHIAEFKLSDTRYDTLSKSEIAFVDTTGIGAEPVVHIEALTQRKLPMTLIRVIPLRKNVRTGKFEKLRSFNYTSQEKPTTFSAGRVAGTQAANTSVLAQGDWYKIAVTNSGLHKIDQNLLRSMGINTASINPKNIRLYGNGGGMLPEPNSSFRYDDLTENAIYVEGENDGVFNNNDYVLFYAQGPDTWQLNASKNGFVHSKNIYSDTAYYFLTIADKPGLRLGNAPTNLQANSALQTTFNDRAFYENEAVNILQSGRVWYGEIFDLVNDRDFRFNMPGIVKDSLVKVKAAVMSSHNGGRVQFNVSLNGNLLGSIFINGQSLSSYANKGSDAEQTFTTNYSGNTNELRVSIGYNKNGLNGATGYLNFLEIEACRTISVFDNQTAFRSLQLLGRAGNLAVQNAGTDLKIWNVTNPLRPINQAYNLNGTQATFGIGKSDTLQEFVAFTGQNFVAPRFIHKVGNQNLHALQVPDLLIITHSMFLDQANRLADFRRSNDKLKVEVVTTTQVYNEFASGAQDLAAIRDFARFLYKKNGQAASRFKYLLLFGACSYDYKYRRSPNTNFVPVYETPQSLAPIESTSSDDWVGLLDDNEGQWRDYYDRHTLDIGIGRFPVRNVTEAKRVVDKVIHYSSSAKTVGKWRNNVCFLTDDGDLLTHQRQGLELAGIVEKNYKAYNTQKIFLANYPHIPVPNGKISPATRNAITRSIEDGVLLFNYTGHGGEPQLADENIVDIDLINKLNNPDKLPFFVTATCSFGRYDDPAIISGGQLLVLRENGGGVGIVTTGRVVQSYTNFTINSDFYRSVFEPDQNGNMPRMGDVMRQTKNRNIIEANRGFAMLGDPSMTLAYPQKKAVITAINGKDWDAQKIDTINGLEKVTLSGEVRDTDGTAKLNNFNGRVFVTIFDKETQVVTYEGRDSVKFGLRNNILYNGLARVNNGDFSISFVVPKDISYLFGKGRISLYAVDSNNIDAHGAEMNFAIGGSIDATDNTPPMIRLYMNDTTFVDGGETNNNPTFLAKLFDENGINISTAGVGHEMTAVIDDNLEGILTLNNYYTASEGNYQKGTVSYPLKDLKDGPHQIWFKAWDTHNNSNESVLHFMVATNAKMALKNLLNYPNPVRNKTSFKFDHNFPGQDLDITVKIYNMLGQPIKSLQYFVSNSTTQVGGGSELTWDGLSDDGKNITSGVYVYEIEVRCEAGSVGKTQQLVVIK